MVGLSIVLECTHKGSNNKNNNNNNPQVVNKATMIKPSPSPPPPSPPPSLRRNSQPCTAALPAGSFLEQCFLCDQKLLPGKDIYMYKGDRAFCSVECRCRQIFMDEEESTTTTSTMYNRPNCSFSAMKAPPPPPCSSSSPSSSRNRKGSRNRANGFAY
ncbi:unnamed protein product [Camellia sinensis]